MFQGDINFVWRDCGTNVLDVGTTAKKTIKAVKTAKHMAAHPKKALGHPVATAKETK